MDLPSFYNSLHTPEHYIIGLQLPQQRDAAGMKGSEPVFHSLRHFGTWNSSETDPQRTKLYQLYQDDAGYLATYEDARKVSPREVFSSPQEDILTLGWTWPKLGKQVEIIRPQDAWL